MIFALIFDKAVFGHNPALTSLVGSILIVTSAMYIALQKESQKQRAQEEKAKQEVQVGAGSSSVQMSEMQHQRSRSASLPARDEEAGLVSGVDADDEDTVEGAKEEDRRRHPSR